MEPMRKRAWYGLLTAVSMIGGIITIAWIKGIETYSSDVVTRLLLDIVLVGGLICHWLILKRTIRKAESGRAVYDERDQTIEIHAMHIQFWAVLLSLFAWSIALSEGFWVTKQVPLVYLYLIAYGSVVINLLAQSVDILLGYWRMQTHG